MTASSDTQLKTSPKRLAVRVICLACAILLLLFLAVGGIILLCGLMPLAAEAGEDTPQERDFLRFPFLPLSCQSDLTDSAFSQIGDHAVQFSFLGIPMRTTLSVRDTNPPQFTVKHHGIRLGEDVSVEDFIADAQDFSSYTAEMLLPETVHAAGDHTVEIRLTDVYGNMAQQSATLSVFAIPDILPMEAGADAETCLETLQNAIPRAVFDGDIHTANVQQQSVSIQIDGFTFPLVLDIRDTCPPAAHIKAVTIQSGTEDVPKPSDFLTTVTDASEVTVTYEKIPDFTTPGKRGLTLVLTDAAGNVSKIRAMLTVTEPEIVAPPVIRGVKNLSMNVGTWISYTIGVSASDSAGNPLAVNVDSSAVKRNNPGTYTISYTATDKNGTTTVAQATVTVYDITEDTLRPYVDKVLNKILREDMTQMERARAIYNWMTTNISYTAYAYKDYWMRAAYSGFTTGRGDCYVYYAMTRSLLNGAGIENMEICRDNPAKPHYWNLVNCGEGWYHFDTCPHYKQYPLESFMLTDAQVKAYSENCVKDYYSFDASLYPATP